jgi:hypothetical protein
MENIQIIVNWVVVAAAFFYCVYVIFKELAGGKGDAPPKK